MIGRRVLVGWLILSGLFVFGANRAAAQMWPETNTVLGSLESSKHVAIFKVVTVEPNPYAEAAENNVEVTEITDPKPLKVTMEVVRTYKGSSKPGDVFVFGQYPGTEEGWSFDATDVGKEFLFYLEADSFIDDLWWVNGANRSRRLEDATDDLLYLNNMAKLAGKTRVSGTVSFVNNDGTTLEGITVQFVGAKGTYVTQTDVHGVYEIYDLPAGKYMMRAAVPKGWKLDEDSWYFDTGEQTENPVELPKFQIIVKPRKHVAQDLYIKTDNAITGKIYFPSGGNLAGQYIKATRLDGTDENGYYVAEIQPDGSFALKGLPGGGYVIVVNEDGVVSSSMPFKEFFYPGVNDKTLAVAVYILPGQVVNGINISAPKPADVITINGRLLFADGSPVSERSVDFTSTNTDPTIYGDVTAITDANGRFTMQILKGMSGTLAGHFFSYIGEYVDSPELDALIRANAEAVATENPEPEPTVENPEAGTVTTEPATENTATATETPEEVATPVYATISTEPMTLEADKDLTEVALQLPFTPGKKAPDPSQ